MYAADLLLHNGATVLKTTSNGIVDEDGADWIALFALEAILKDAKVKSLYPKDLTLLSQAMIDKLFEDEKFKKILEPYKNKKSDNFAK